MARRCVNKVELIGFVGEDPVTRYSGGGDAVATLSVATTESWKDKVSGEKKERTEWHRCVAYDKFAENVVGKLPKKGSYVRVEGSLRTRKWQDKAGQDRYTTELVLSDLIMLDPAPAEKAPVSNPPKSDTDDDYPF